MPQEIELKFVLPGWRAEQALQGLRAHPLLRRRRVQQQWLLNRYYDTPDGWLQGLRCALRLRAIERRGSPGNGAAPRTRTWEQTLKTAGSGSAALSVRGEWTTPLSRPALDPAALRNTPLGTVPDLDARLAALQPVYETRCLRTTWTVRTRDGSVVEVALDAGDIRAQGRRTPLLELELELLAGDPNALHALAAELASHLPLLPLRLSKAEQAQRLCNATHQQPIAARPLTLARAADPMAVARAALGDALGQLCDNLALAARYDDPELIHQARVGWRRWRSLLRLLRPWLPPPPDRQPLQPLLEALGAVRDLDVAATETLPAWAEAFIGHPAPPLHARAWQIAQRRLQIAARRQRDALRACLGDPALGQALLAHSRWLLTLPERIDAPADWAAQRLARWHKRLRRSLDPDNVAADTDEALHAARLLAKRLRYGSEVIAPTLAAKATQRLAHWEREARAWQTRLGRWHDTERAAQLLDQLRVTPTLAAYLHGAAAALRSTLR